jgi:radical SAM-linked protein
VVMRVRIRYAKRGRLRFSSHRDFARAFERALRRARVPMAYSAGFTPHPKISYLGAAPTGAASEAEYLEIGLVESVDVTALREALDEALPAGLDILEAVPARSGGLAERIQAAHWRIDAGRLPVDAVEGAVVAFLTRDRIRVPKMTKTGQREVDVRAAVVSLRVSESHEGSGRAILDTVVRLVTPAVRPEDVMTALCDVGGLGTAEVAAMVATRLAQGPLGDDGSVGDPLAVDRVPHS